MLFATAQKPEGESSRQLPTPISKPNASVPLAEQPPPAIKGSFDSKILLGIAMAAILLVPLLAVLGGLLVFVGFKVQPAIVVRDSNDQSVHERYGSIPTDKPGDWDEPSSRVAEGPSPEGQPSVEFPSSHPTYVDDWKCRIRLIHPLLGDLTAEKWLVDGTEIVVEIDRWRSRPMVRQQWGRIMDRAKELAAVAEQPIRRVVDLTLRTGTDALMVPVVLTYRPDGADVSNGNRASPEDPFG